MQLCTPNMEIDLPPIDFRRLQLVAETEREKASFLEVFFETAEGIIAEMSEARHSNKSAQWKDAAHKLRGAAANIGMASLEKICLESERAETENSACDTLLRQINGELDRIKAFIAERAPLLLASRI